MLGLLDTVSNLRDIFDKYAGKDGDKKTMTKSEMADLLKKEFSAAGPMDKAKVDSFFSSLDNDGDGLVSFQEFASFVAALSVILTEN